MANITDSAPDTANVEVPAQHHSLVTRMVELLKNAESDIVDNVEAGINYLESLWKERSGTAEAEQDAKSVDTPDA